ncbi:hypothetical protein PPERSA_07602 [Pseudocohnilembus persalinus]|uniref:Uncharacterized protein n=1 Tax=Pseudocohnilembus persalinus TaxID=266149 RepID=A0A0V0QIU8_PSEPJ|nr:hypothetical protein PPERSA_07602 [Pseudocohnilembus persalinus]|eukprot:KRX01957.1 hypothetical protein PPERSA_07602 [Pseudocohnilembus persalinus]
MDIEEEIYKINYEVLKKSEPNLTKIIAKSGQSQLYYYDYTIKHWSEMSIKGPIFLIQQKDDTGKLIILNLEELEPFKLQLNNNQKFEKSPDNKYIYYKQNGEVYCIHISQMKDLERLYEEIQQFIF